MTGSNGRVVNLKRCHSIIRSFPLICTVRRWSSSVSLPLWRSKKGVAYSQPLARQPVVSAANVAQLAADLLIASLSLRLIGVFDSCDLVPVVGGRDDREEGVSTPLEREPFVTVQVSFPSSSLKNPPPQFSEKKGATFWSFSSGHPSCLYVLSSLCRIGRKSSALCLTPDFLPSSRESKNLSIRFSSFFGNQSLLRPCFCPVSTCLTGQMRK